MLLELAIGDAYGAGFEYADAAFVRRCNDLSDYVKHPRHDLRPGCYTDDTQMSLAIAESLVESIPWTPENLAGKFVEVFRRDPRRGYAGGFYRFLQQVSDGAEFLECIRPDSDKSGAAMRAAPLGVLASVDDVLQRCEVQARITHNTADGVAAAQAAALMSHYFVYSLGPRERVAEFIAQHVPGQWSEPWRGKVGSRGWMSVRAAITAVRSCRSMRDLLRQCVSFCGDVDTVAAIALAAAAHSSEVGQDLPDRLVQRLENGTYGRSYLCQLDARLMKLVQPGAASDSRLLQLLKDRLAHIEPLLSAQPFVHLHTFERDGRRLHLALTDRLRKTCRKEGIWKSKEMVVTLKNARYGYDEHQARSPGGRDGLFLMDRDFRPPNAMMRKLFDRFLDHPHSEAAAIAQSLQTTVAHLKPVRLVSHHLRLLGILHQAETEDWVVLVDCDKAK